MIPSPVSHRGLKLRMQRNHNYNHDSRWGILPRQGLEMITFIIYNPRLQTSFLLISDYLENPVLEVLSKFSTSHNTANIYGSGAGSY